MALDTITIITALGACRDAREWAADYPDPQEAWDACPRGDWMAWWLGALGARAGQGSPEHRRAVLVACLCARTAPRLPAESLRALDLIEAWAWGGEDCLEDARQMAYAASVAYAATYAAAYAAYAAANAANAAADAAANAYAANAAAWHNARRDHLAALADLIRAAVPVVPLPGGE